jgi:2-polyprenyl-6-methoxyphenol hydroxylase-like FAD-dependent oxidoreductase
VIGGGPAGSTIAALLAERGHRVILAEKDRHPRFHIGESLLPHNLPLFDRLGVRQEIEWTSMPKHAIEFVSPYHGKSVTYDFARALDRRFPYSFQVRRSTFDHVLLKNAAAKGAQIIEGCRIISVAFPEGAFPEGAFPEGADPRIDGRDDEGRERSWSAAFVVDATGRDTLLAAQLGLKERNRRNNSAAIFGHFIGARRLPGKAEGNLSVVWFDNGWFWFIPLADGATSVGAVCPAEFLKNRGTDLTSFFMSVIASCPEIANRLRDARLAGPVTATGNYSYGAKRASGEKFILVGDAAEFIDPVFSSGVYLAMTMAFRGAEAVEACLGNPRRAPRALRRYDAAPGPVVWFIYRIREPAMRNLFMSPRNWFRMEEAILALLAGELGGGWTIRSRLLMFRTIYYITKLAQLPHHLRARIRANSPPRAATG